MGEEFKKVEPAPKKRLTVPTTILLTIAGTLLTVVVARILYFLIAKA